MPSVQAPAPDGSSQRNGGSVRGEGGEGGERASAAGGFSTPRSAAYSVAQEVSSSIARLSTNNTASAAAAAAAIYGAAAPAGASFGGAGPVALDVDTVKCWPRFMRSSLSPLAEAGRSALLLQSLDGHLAREGEGRERGRARDHVLRSGKGAVRSRAPDPHHAKGERQAGGLGFKGLAPEEAGLRSGFRAERREGGSNGSQAKGDGRRSDSVSDSRALEESGNGAVAVTRMNRGHGYDLGVYEKGVGKLGHRFYARLAERLGLPTEEDASRNEAQGTWGCEGRSGDDGGVVTEGDVIVPSGYSPVSLLSPSAYWLFRGGFEPTRDFLKEVRVVGRMKAHRFDK